MSWYTDDRWTCPSCGRTETFTGPVGELLETHRRGVQKEHAARHAPVRPMILRTPRYGGNRLRRSG